MHFATAQFFLDGSTFKGSTQGFRRAYKKKGNNSSVNLNMKNNKALKMGKSDMTGRKRPVVKILPKPSGIIYEVLE